MEGYQHPGAASGLRNRDGQWSIGVLVNRTVAPFDNPDVRRVMAPTLDRKSFIDILGQGEGKIGGTIMPPPDGGWGMPEEMR